MNQTPFLPPELRYALRAVLTVLTLLGLAAAQPAPQQATDQPAAPGQTAPSQTAPSQTAPSQTAQGQTAQGQTAQGQPTAAPERPTSESTPPEDPAPRDSTSQNPAPSPSGEPDTPAAAPPASEPRGAAEQGGARPGQPRQGGAAAAQRPARADPELRVSTLTPFAGESIELSGSGLPAGSQVTAQLTAPSGAVTRQSARVEDSGAFTLDLRLPREGDYQLVVRGEGLDETRALDVQQAPPAEQPSSGQPNGQGEQASSPQNSNAEAQTPQNQGAATEDEPGEQDQAGAAQPTAPNQQGPQPTDESAGNATTPAAPQSPAATPTQPQRPAASSPTQAQETTAPPEPPEISLVNGALSARRDGTPLWRLSFPAGSGATTEPLFTGERLYVGHGTSVLELEPESGTVKTRLIVSGPVAKLERVNDLTTAVTVQHTATLAERFTLRGNTLQEPVRFGLAPAPFGFLRAEAEVGDAAARLARDPTNPWLYLALGLRQGSTPEAARQTLARAVDTASTFYDLAGLAQVLEENGEAELAERAFAAAMQDFAARGYDPRLLQDAALERAYNFPLEPLRAATTAGDDITAARWAERLYLAAPAVPGADAALSDYVALLRPFAPSEEVALWERRARGEGTTGSGALDRAATALGRVGWEVAAALLAAFVLLHLVLVTKYARARRVNRLEGGRTPWLFALRYYTLSEKLVLLLLLAAVLASAALANWYGLGRDLPDALRSGTLANRAAEAYLEDATTEVEAPGELRGPRAAFIRSYAAQVADQAGAQALLEDAGPYAPALNNLGALTDDAALYDRALALEPTLPAARYNTGDTAALPFFASYQPGQPALAAPSANDFQTASSGPWQAALTGAFTNPWQSLQGAVPYSFNLVLWRAAQLLFLLLVFVAVVFLFVPRPRSAHGAPRLWFYELFALLVPGSGLADEAWGIFLLVPWAVFGMGALAQPLGWGVDLGLRPLALYLVLAGLYLVNTAAVIVELVSHRSRQRALELRRTRSART